MAGTSGAGIGSGRPTNLAPNSALWNTGIFDKRDQAIRLAQEKVASQQDAINAANRTTHAREEAEVTSAYGGGGNEDPPAPPPQLNYSGKTFQYNVGCVKDAYFSPRASFNQLLFKDASGSIQDKPVKVESSSQLWSAAGKTKGMISLFLPSNPDTTMDAITPP